MKPPRSTFFTPRVHRCPTVESSSRAQTAVAVARVSWGCLLIVLPLGLIRTLGLPSDRRAIATIRVLGLRHLVQAAVVGGSGRRIRVGALVDLLHGVSMLLLASFDAPRRRAALLDATVAFGFGAGGVIVGTEDSSASANGLSNFRRAYLRGGKQALQSSQNVNVNLTSGLCCGARIKE